MEQQQRRQRGEGSVYQNPRSRFLWIKYHLAGKAFRESSQTTDPAKAAKFLRQRMAQVERGESGGAQLERVRIDNSLMAFCEITASTGINHWALWKLDGDFTCSRSSVPSGQRRLALPC